MKPEEIQKLALERFPIIKREYDIDKYVDLLYGDRTIWIEGFNKAIELLAIVTKH